jgi:hypothetical protein
MISLPDELLARVEDDATIVVRAPTDPNNPSVNWDIMCRFGGCI